MSQRKARAARQAARMSKPPRRSWWRLIIDILTNARWEVSR